MAMTTEDLINEDLILQTKNTSMTDQGGLKTLKEAREAFEKDYISSLLSITKGNVTNAAKFAGKYRSDFYNLLKKYNLQASDFKEP
jgi:two-component system response regulator GlrR